MPQVPHLGLRELSREASGPSILINRIRMSRKTRPRRTRKALDLRPLGEDLSNDVTDVVFETVLRESPAALKAWSDFRAVFHA